MTEKQTTLDLNGPILSFIQQPVAVSTTLSTATFVGIATATFPTQTPANPATNTGTIEYRWYVGESALTDGSFRGATISGTATTTLTLSSLKSPETNNVNFFLRADYTPSAYGLPGVAITEGTARFTGNAVNDPLDSNTATLTVLPTITITSQPGIATVGSGSRAIFTVEASISDSGFGDLSYQWNVDGQNLTDNGTTIIGANQPTLFFIPSSVGISTVKVTVSNPNATSVVSNIVNLNVVNPRNIIIIEGYTPQNNYSLVSTNLDQVGNFTLTDTTFGSNFNIINFYAAENNIDAELEIRTSKGLDTGSYFGGQGGISRIRITLEKNIEYTVLGISNNSGLFIYRGSTLIAAVGKGGDAGSLGNGGAGGGVNDSGGSGSGRNSGFGGVRPSAGELTTNGIFGSNSTITTFLPGDSKATIPNGGRTISCPKGSYWVDVRGVPPCSNIGFSQFYNTNQTLIPQSSLINRGFKPGYTITSTEGARISNGGTGGTGATGGSGGDGGGGGGGSGYTNNSYTVLSSSFGGNNSLKSTINFKVFVPPPVLAAAPPSGSIVSPPAPEPAPAPGFSDVVFVQEPNQTFCPDPEMRILMSDGTQKRSGDLKEGDLIYTQHEKTFEWGNYKINFVKVVPNIKKYKILFSPQKEFICSDSHSFYVDEKGWTNTWQLKIGDIINENEVILIEKIESGFVVKIEVEDAHTYICEGLLSHNITKVSSTFVGPLQVGQTAPIQTAPFNPTPTPVTIVAPKPPRTPFPNYWFNSLRS
jgi:hypothetical protein